MYSMPKKLDKSINQRMFLYFVRKKKDNIIRYSSKFDASSKAKVTLKVINISPLKITAWKNEFSQKAHAAIIKLETSQNQLVNLNVKQDHHLKRVGELSIENVTPENHLRSIANYITHLEHLVF